MDTLRATPNPFLTDIRAPPVIRYPLVTRENIVMTAKLRRVLPLRNVYEALLHMGAKYNQQRPRVLVQTSLGTANIYAKSIVVTGAHSEDGGHLLLSQILLMLMRYDSNAYQPPEVRYATIVEHPVAEFRAPRLCDDTLFPAIPLPPSSDFAYDVRLQNMVGCVRTGHHMETLWTMKHQVLKEASYEPNVFPGLMAKVKLNRPTGVSAQVAVTFHTSGSAIITGATSDWDLWNAASWACTQIWETYKQVEQQHSQESRYRVLKSNGFVSLTEQLNDSNNMEHREMFGGVASVTPAPNARSGARASSAPASASSSTTRLVDPATRTHIQTVLSDSDLEVVSETISRINQRLDRLKLRTPSPSPSPSPSPLSSRSSSSLSNKRSATEVSNFYASPKRVLSLSTDNVHQ